MSNYYSYYPDLIEEWKAGNYEAVAKALAQKNRMDVSVFCCDLYHLEIGTARDRLARLALEVAIAEEFDIVDSTIRDIVSLETCIEEWKSLVERWSRNHKPEWDELVRKLVEYPKCYLISFVSSAILLSTLDESLKHFYMGLLGGSLSRIEDDL